MKNLPILIAFFAMPFLSFGQQRVAKEVTEYNYTIKIQDIGSWSDDTSIKIVQTYLKLAFEKIVPMNKHGEFETTTSFPIKESSLDRILNESGFQLAEFSLSTDADNELLQLK